MEEKLSLDVPESVPYIIQNLKAVYGVPSLEGDIDPLDALIQTILSQSTTNVNSHRAFENLKRRFPTWEQARRARASSIEAAIRSGGLARQKSVRIKNLLNEIYERRGSLDLSFLRTAPLEEAREFLSGFKGVGPKTVACTLLFACHRPVFPIDTHIFRIARRLGLIPEKCSDEEAHRLMEAMLPEDRYYEIHVNLIRHGRKVCRPTNPLCDECCLIDYCRYYEMDAGPSPQFCAHALTSGRDNNKSKCAVFDSNPLQLLQCQNRKKRRTVCAQR
ncbi:MAG TPA: endonuclease III [Blastocatellia bacterium]|nr:endonuclease III [Blastocatellia bacterium]